MNTFTRNTCSALAAIFLMAGCNEPNAEQSSQSSGSSATADATVQVNANDPTTQQDNASPMEIISYNMGQQIAAFIQQNNPEADIESVKAGLEDALTGKPAKFSEIETQTAMAAYQAKMQSEAMAAASENQAKADAFLAENKTAEGVKTTDSGLQYKVITAGEGDAPAATDTVSVHYRGTLIDGTEFDSSYSRGQPTSFPVNGVIAGWQEGLQLMKPGSKFQFFIPPNLAYGERGAGADIGPNAALVFEVELLAVNP